jgi:hypothetical protein
MEAQVLPAPYMGPLFAGSLFHQQARPFLRWLVDKRPIFWHKTAQLHSILPFASARLRKMPYLCILKIQNLAI